MVLILGVTMFIEIVSLLAPIFLLAVFGKILYLGRENNKQGRLQRNSELE